jgi:hypothetical protein
VVAGGTHDAEGVAGFLLKNQIDGVEAGAGRMQRYFERTRVDVGVAGAEGVRAAQNISARNADVLA